MSEETFASSFDHTLTTQNARSRGYQWEIDVIRNDQGKIENVEGILQKVRNEGYRLGQPWANDKYKAPYGLYRPLAKSAQTLKKV